MQPEIRACMRTGTFTCTHRSLRVEQPIQTLLFIDLDLEEQMGRQLL